MDEKRIAKEIETLLHEATVTDEKEDALHGAHSSGDEIPLAIRRQEDRIKKLKELREKISRRWNKEKSMPAFLIEHTSQRFAPGNGQRKTDFTKNTSLMMKTKIPIPVLRERSSTFPIFRSVRVKSH